MTAPRTTDELETLEADARRLMAKIAAIPDRGFDSARERGRLIRDLDDLLDAHNGHDVTPRPVPAAAQPHPELLAYLAAAETGDPDSRTCGVCGRSRYVSTTGARACIACDHVTSGVWDALDDTTT